jgi:hypothetical protein
MKIEDFAESWMREHHISWGSASQFEIVSMLKDVLALPRYTEDIDEAWGMLEALKDLDPEITTTVSWDRITWNCTIRKGEKDFVSSSFKAAPMAISMALHHWRERLDG